MCFQRYCIFKNNLDIDYFWPASILVWFSTLYFIFSSNFWSTDLVVISFYLLNLFFVGFGKGWFITILQYC